MTDIPLSIADAQNALNQKKIGAEELCKAHFERIQNTTKFGSYLALDPEGAQAQAKASDRRRAQNETLGDLDGIPIALKDNILSEGLKTTCGSNILGEFIPPYDATVTRLLKQAGAVILGKTNMDEFAMGSSNEHSAFGVVKNPWDESCVPGGSSGGSAAAVAARAAMLSLGTDTGGSIRQPASFCGVVGLKPSYGRVSRFGVVAFGSSLDQVGPFGRRVRDVATALDILGLEDPKDSTSASVPPAQSVASLEHSIAGKVIGLPKEYFGEGLDSQTAQAIDNARRVLEDLGATFVDVSLPHTDAGIATYYVLATAEASSNLARFDGVRFGVRHASEDGLHGMYSKTRGKAFGDEVQRRIMLGTYVLSSGYYDAYYRRAQKVRALIAQDFEAAFSKVDALLTPSTPGPAFKLGDNTQDPIKMYLADVYTVGSNLAGNCGLSLPCGISKDGLPLGMQLLGKSFNEATILNIAHRYESAAGIIEPGAWP